ncbi:phosphoadenosine phosphosulfate reductase family protein [Acaryochloris sp. CCMEE 5410]|uniref:phosphoadenosine phosphosulfate reductase domain-containing protein n=1 Tax=Acaryochloris sp. CCMEE 5410 TaxID=310037 RepID=UPI0002484EFF|nr:phosphoadenosine phosphosulfate reductase family protein [Acaryochloris sp. CCMEE 5410]KAI9129846.1 phosphoadenosine phosphosulfate reductase family protein [Acaryochloris sp. CCMEE 5410]
MSATQMVLPLQVPGVSTLPDLSTYDCIIVAFSGGKDSICCLLRLMELGVDRSKIELHHHLVDGLSNTPVNPQSSTLFDWPVTENYCRKFAQAFDLPLYMSWLEGGLEREMCRKDQPKAPTHFETPDGEQVSGGQGKPGTRCKFPAKTADLKTRWCSSYLKIDVLSTAIANQSRFNHSRTLVVTGERAQESAARAKYQSFEPHRTDRRDSHKLRRHIDHWRPVHAYTTEQIWGTIQRWGVQAHPAYHLGWGRLSCQFCIFGSPNQWASNLAISPERTERLHQYEQAFQHTIDNKLSIPEMATKGKVYEAIHQHPDQLQLALSQDYTAPILIDPNAWTLPAGAFGEDAGPT